MKQENTVSHCWSRIRVDEDWPLNDERMTESSVRMPAKLWQKEMARLKTAQILSDPDVIRREFIPRFLAQLVTILSPSMILYSCFCKVLSTAMVSSELCMVISVILYWRRSHRMAAESMMLGNPTMAYFCP